MAMADPDVLARLQAVQQGLDRQLAAAKRRASGAVTNAPDGPEEPDTGWLDALPVVTQNTAGKNGTDPIQLIKIGVDTDGEEAYLAPEAAKAFILMSKMAELDGYQIQITSAYRTYKTQKRLWNERRSGKSKYPAASPGGSVHESGKAVDINTLDGGARGWQWAIDNCKTFNFKHNVAGDAPHFEFTGTPVDAVAILTKAQAYNLQRIASASSRDTAQLAVVHTAAVEAAGPAPAAPATATATRADRADRVALRTAAASREASIAAAGKTAVIDVAAGASASEITFVDVDNDPFSYDFTTGLWGDGNAL